MAEQSDSDRNEDLSPIIPTKARKMSIFHRGPTSSLESRLLSTRHPVTEDEPSLYYMLKTETSVDINNIVNEWVQYYKRDKEGAFSKLMQLIVNAAGKIGTVSSEILNIKNTDFLVEMPTDPENGDGKCPIIRNGQPWKLFNVNYTNFLQELVKSCQNTILYDGFLLDKVFSRLELLMNSLYRPFRHVAIITTSKLIISMMDVVLPIVKESEDIIEQCESDDDDEVYETVNAKHTELVEKCVKHRKIFKFVIDNILSMSFRDCYSEIRIRTLSELSIWMEKFPECFVQEKVLHYIGLLLHDKVPAVRSKSVEILQLLYDREESKPVLLNFVENFKTRLLFMLMDKKDNIIIQVINLIKTMVFQDYPFSDKSVSYIYFLVFEAHRGISKTALKFLEMMLIKTSKPTDKLRVLEDKGYILYMVQFSIEAHLEKLNNLLVDSLIEITPVIKNWESYIELLQQGIHTVEPSEDDHAELIIIDFMLHCIKQVATGRSPRVKNIDDCNMSLKKSDDRRRMTLIFIQNLSALLDKYLINKEKISRLIEIPLYFDDDEQIFIEHQEEMISILDNIRHIAFAFQDPYIFVKLAMLLNKFSTFNQYYYDYSYAVRLLVIDECKKRCSQGINKLDQSTSLSRNSIHLGENTDNITDSLMTISIFYEYLDLNENNVITWIFPYIQNFSELSDHPNILIYSLRCSYFSLLWNLVAIFNCVSPDQISAKTMEILQKIFEKYIALYLSIISHSLITRVRQEAFSIMCNVLLFYSEKLIALKNVPQFNLLKCKPSFNTCEAMNLFIQSTIFKENEEERGKNLVHEEEILIAYSKLIMFDIVPVNQAVQIIQHYNIWFDKYGSIIEEMLNYIYKFNKNVLFNIFMICLQTLFRQIRETCEIIDTSAVKFTELKELAKKLGSLFPLKKDTKTSIRMLHKNAISFSFEGWHNLQNEDLETSTVLSPPPNLCFLEILTEFKYKYSKADKKYILKILDQKVQNDITHLQDEGWHSFSHFRNSISHQVN